MKKENYSAVIEKNEQRVNEVIAKLMELGRITEVVEPAHPMLPRNPKYKWVAYVR